MSEGQARVATWKLGIAFLAGGALIPLPGTLFSLTLHLSKPSELRPLHRLHNSIIAVVSGCGVVVDGVVVNDGRGDWSVWYKSVDDINPLAGRIQEHGDEVKDKEQGGGSSGLTRAKILQGCR